MKRIPNRDAYRYVEQLGPFSGSNLCGMWTPHGYVVYSYGLHFPLLVYIDGMWFANKDKYNRFTSRHLSQVRPDIRNPSVKLHWLSTRWMQRLAAGGIAELAKARVLEGVTV